MAGKLGAHIYSHLWLIKGEGPADGADHAIGESQSVHFSLAALHGYRLPAALLEVARALR